MSRRLKEAIVLAIDCGQSMSGMCLNGKRDETVFKVSKHCLQNIIKQKIFAETKNEYLLMEFSTQPSGAHNSGDIRVFSSLCSPNFDLLRYISNELKPTDRQTNVMDALDEAINQMIVQTRGQKFSDLKIALFTNFGLLDALDLNRFQTQISRRLEENFIKLLLICDFTPDSHSRHDLTKSQILGLELMELVQEKDLGFCYELHTAVHQFGQFEGRKTSPFAWYSKLELGKGMNALNIPIGAYVKAEAYKRKTGKDAYVRPNDSQTTDNNGAIEVKTETSFTEIGVERAVTYKARDEQSVEMLEKEDVVPAYSYGQTLVQFTEEDKKAFNYDKREKGLKTIGFTSLKNIDISHRIGNKSYVVFPDPRPKQNNHKLVFQALVAAMIEKQEVAIVRYGWSDRSSPQMGYLCPHIEDNDMLLVYIQLPFEEDVRKYRFPSLDSKPNYCPTEPQLEAIDSLIDAMDLMRAGIDEDGNPCEALQTDQISDPILQHWFECLSHRQVYGTDVDLPKVADYLKDLIEPPLEICEKASKPLAQIKQKFSLECLNEKSKKKRNHLNANNSQSTSASQPEPKRARISDKNNESRDELIRIQTIKSEVNDWIESKFPFEQISHKLNDSLKGFFEENNTKLDSMGEEIADLIQLFRKESVQKNSPKDFNEFMLNCVQRFRGTNLWYILLSKEIGLIGQTECPNSDVAQEVVENYTNLSEDLIKAEIK